MFLQEHKHGNLACGKAGYFQMISNQFGMPWKRIVRVISLFLEENNSLFTTITASISEQIGLSRNEKPLKKNLKNVHNGEYSGKIFND